MLQNPTLVYALRRKSASTTTTSVFPDLLELFDRKTLHSSNVSHIPRLDSPSRKTCSPEFFIDPLWGNPLAKSSRACNYFSRCIKHPLIVVKGRRRILRAEFEKHFLVEARLPCPVSEFCCAPSSQYLDHLSNRCQIP